MFHHLKTGISLLLGFVGLKLLLHNWLDQVGFKSVYSLYIILFILSGSILLSMIHPKEAKVRE
jgi:tellurite resistance protein TerC